MFKQKTSYSYKNPYKKQSYTLKEKIIFTILILCFIQFLSGVPLFGINRNILSSYLNSSILSNLSIFNLFSGMSFQNMSIFALGIAPYITSSIILQLLRIAIPRLDELCKDGQYGKEKTEKFTYIGACIVGILEIIPFVYSFSTSNLIIKNNALYTLLIGIQLFLGSAILIILGKLIDKRGIGNGISLILLINILSSIPTDIYNIYTMFIQGKNILNIVITIFIILFVLGITLIGTIYLQEGKKEVKTSFAGKLSNNKMSRYNESSIPLRVNMSGVMPIIFASSLMQMGPICITLFNIKEGSIWYTISKFLNQAYWFDLKDFKYTLGVIPYIVLVVFFSYFYNMISFNTTEVAQNLAKRGGTIKGIRTGKATSEYLDNQLKYLLLLGSLILIVIALIPVIVSGIFNISLSFGGTSVLIIVSVIMETYKIIEVETSTKKSNLLGGLHV